MALDGELLQQFVEASNTLGKKQLWNEIEELLTRLAVADYDQSRHKDKIEKLRAEQHKAIYSRSTAILPTEIANLDEMSSDQLRRVLANLKRHLANLNENEAALLGYDPEGEWR